MVVKAWSLLDTKTGLFSSPWFMPHRAYAIRAVCELAADKATSVGRYPLDYALYQIGEFDDCAGVLISLPPDLVGTVAAIVAAAESTMN